MKKIILLIVIVVVVCVAGWYVSTFIRSGFHPFPITSFETCVAHGYPIMESYPRQCRTPDGRNFVEQISTATSTSSDLIVVDSPKAGDVVTSPIHISGKAHGNWFFEASFPVILKDPQGELLAQAPAQAKGDWMTNDFVPFEATLTFLPAKCIGVAYPCSVPATLVLKKDNPSGLPQNDAQIEIPIKISEQVATSTVSSCKPTGCSGQICSDKEVITTCEYRTEYACYKPAKCERQKNSQCGWTQTPTLEQCLKDASIVDTDPNYPI